MSSVTRTMTEERQSGTTCFRMMRVDDPPCSRTAWMNSELRMVSVSARAIRA